MTREEDYKACINGVDGESSHLEILNSWEHDGGFSKHTHVRCVHR